MCHGVPPPLYSLFAAEERGFLVPQPQALVAAAIRHFDEHAGNASVAVSRQRRLIRGRIKHSDRERGWIPPRPARCPAFSGSNSPRARGNQPSQNSTTLRTV